MGGGSEDWRVMLNSTQDQIKLKLKFELSLATIEYTECSGSKVMWGKHANYPYHDSCYQEGSWCPDILWPGKG